MLGSLNRHKILTTLVLLVVLLIAFIGYRMRGPHRSYRADQVKPNPHAAVPSPGTLEVGVARRDITPDLSKYDTWTDADNDGHFDPKKGDTYQERNGNGKMDLVWLAGFSSNRPAKGVHDPLYASAVAFRNNGVTLVMVTIDSIGIFHEHYINIRKSLDPALGIDHVMFSAIHDHEAPDTMGIWSYSALRPKFDHGYMHLIEQACREAIEEAVGALQPADMVSTKIEINPSGLVEDTRKPIVIDKTICLARFTKTGTDKTIATMASWGNHPETLAGDNGQITSDFVHYWRRGVEEGIAEPKGAPGLGGEFLYFQGPVGGLMTQLHIEIPHRDGIRKFKTASFDKAEALGENLALLTVNGLRAADVAQVQRPVVAVVAKTIFAPVEGLFKWPMMLGLIHPGWYSGGARTEIDALKVGDIEIIAIPGELYPEIAEGGIEWLPGADYPGPVIEEPPLRRWMKGRVNMVICLANDEIGYIIPKTQWDTKPPFVYNDKPQYGEGNSAGPNIAPLIHRNAIEVLDTLHTILPMP